MPDPSKLTRHLPPAWERETFTDQYSLMSGLEAGFVPLRAEVTSLENEQSLTTGANDGLTRKTESYGLFRPPGMNDATLSTLAKAIVGARRGTLAAIKAVFEAATGIAVDVNDKQTDGTIASFVIVVSPASGFSWDTHGRALYAGQAAVTRYPYPTRSGVGGIVFAGLGETGGLVNDHAFSPVDVWILDLVNRVRPAGTRIIVEG